MVGLGIFVATRSASRPSTDQRSTRLADVISQTINSQGIDAGVAQYRSLRERGFPGLSENFSDTNKLGYQFLGKGENQAAIQIFQLNVETHPKSSHAYDSLGEAYAAAGNKELSIENYRKALALNPENTNSKAALLRLTGRPATPYSPLLWFHIVGGTVGLLSGFLALVFAQRLAPSSLGRKSICRLDDVHGRSRGMAGFYEISAVQCSWRHSHNLLCGNSLGHHQTPCRRNQ